MQVWGGWLLGIGRGGDGRVCGRMGANVRGMGGCCEMGECWGDRRVLGRWESTGKMGECWGYMRVLGRWQSIGDDRQQLIVYISLIGIGYCQNCLLCKTNMQKLAVSK